ncbi:Na/Pi cotransporter family protein [Mesorhizobium sp.]|uniref:Na/Pi cotransporter family protein n=1 Tax=Mesorhizobium sp. TaxID=1871066 RepID=UPI00121109AE|nr:Na/Pi symporter [Mesorhizobium sp.]TIP14309.1 MAG: Na/Pi cotransporter family protein [Mesorhizobium sp.]
MTILSLLVQLSSGAMLLLFSVRFMRIGIERLWGVALQYALAEGSSILPGLLRGAVLGFVMQGGTVVMLMAAGLAGSGAVSISSASILALGADLGSAIAVGFLQLPISAVGPLVILIGATLYLRAPQPRLRNFGRVVLGLGLIFLALSIIRASVEPIANLESTAGLALYLTRDTIAAALAGIGLTLAMHSSVAAILTAVAFSGIAIVGPAAAISFVLGCNIGSALLPLWLLKGESKRTRIVPAAVGVLRVVAAMLVIVFLAVFRASVDNVVRLGSAQAMLVCHLTFNFLLLLSAPLCRRLARDFEVRLAQPVEQDDASIPAGFIEDSSIAEPAVKRKLGTMLDLASSMLDEVTCNLPEAEKIRLYEERMNATLTGIRDAYARVNSSDDASLAGLQQIVDFAIRIERCGDVLAGKLLTLRLDQLRGSYQFTEQGNREITEMVEAVRRTIILAHETAWTGDPVPAERLVRHKQHVSDLEERSRHRHLSRLRGGNLISLASSNQHLETIAALKEINSKMATIGYAVLEQHGGLKKTRLKSSVTGSAT